jgi:beta-glucosidase
MRLAGFTKLELKPGERRTTDTAIDPRLLAQWKAGRWRMTAGTYKFALGSSATALADPVEVTFAARDW